MKRLIVIVCVFIGIMMFPATVYADSPITSTFINFAYQDYAIVQEASETGLVSQDIAEYLADPANPIDVKAAVINALSWDFNDKTNVETYCDIVYDKSLEDIDVEELSGDQQFCIGYLMVMDDYFDTDPALEVLRLAEQNITDSFTVSIIRALVESMDLMDNSWADHIEPVLKNDSLIMDMRPDAVNIILDYMALYTEEEEMEVSRNNITVGIGESEIIYLYGTYSVFSDMEYYEITKSSNIASVEIGQDEYYIYYVKITGVESGSSSIKIEYLEDIDYMDNKSIIINFDVVTSIPKTGVASMSLVFGIGAIAMASLVRFCKRKEGIC